MNPFSKKADELLEKSVELDNAAKPGDTYTDPVWGEISVPPEVDQESERERQRMSQFMDKDLDTVSNDRYCPKCGRPKSEPHCGFGESWQ